MASLAKFGKEEIKQLAAFYGEEDLISTCFQHESFQFPPVIDGDVLFLSGLYLEERYFMKKKLSCLLRSSPRVLLSSRYSKEFKRLTHMVVCIFPEMLKLINIMLTLPVGTATVERSLSQMKMIKTRLRNRLNGTNLKRLMQIAIEGPEMKLVDFDEVLDVFRENNRRISL